jgi:hypothetical protein
MFFAIAAILAIMALTACTPRATEPVVVTREVKIPIGELIQPPAELKRGAVTDGDLPVWIEPTDKRASSCLAPEGEAKLRALVTGRESLLDGWESWIR